MINKKGMTLIELLVCVTLVSGIMVFMYKLISDVRNQKKNIDNLNDIYLKIEDSIVDIENGINTIHPDKITLDTNKVIFENTGDKKQTIITVENNVISMDNNTKKWTYETASSSELCYTFSDTTKMFLLKVYLKDKNDKYIDAIEVPYYEKNLNVIVNANDSNWNECS